MLPLAGYTRVSRVGDREETLISPELQRDRITSFVDRRDDLAVDYLQTELDVSGGKATRPILEQAIEGVEHGRYSGIIVADIDRLSRMNLADALRVIDRVEAADGQVIAVAQNFDATTPEGEWARNVWLSTAHMMLKRYSAQFQSAKQSAVERGVWPVPRAPRGYTVVRRKDGGDGVLKPDPATRDTVVAAFEARAGGKSWRAIADLLGCGVSGAQKTIHNRVYLGELHLADWVNLAAHEPLIGRALWEAAQVQQPRPPRGTGPGALLAGLVRCAGCQGAMTTSGQRGEICYRCQDNKAGGHCGSAAMMSQRKLDTYVEGVALAELERLTITSRKRTTELERAQKGLANAEAELGAYYEVTQITKVGAEAFQRGARIREQAIEDARLELGRQWGHPNVPAEDHPGTVGDLWPDLSLEEKRHVLRSSLDVVWVKRGSGPAVDRVRIIATGYGPSPNVGGRRRIELTPINWVDDLPGELAAAGA